MRSSHQERTGRQTTDPSGRPQYADRVYRSTAGFISGAVLIVLALWLGGDAVIRGNGQTPWLALAALLMAIPLVAAFTVRPAVFAGAERIRIRNPFRTITMPWAAVDRIRSSYSTELFAGGRKFQLWSIPVSVRARKRAIKQTERARSGEEPFGVPGRRRTARPTQPATGGEEVRAWSDRAVAELNELSDQHEVAEGEPRPEPVIRWCYEVIAPAVAGAVLLIVLLTT
ncbi:PH domain-containing protein [Streptomyces sp. NBC_01476]|uniref:PH domain-containing protein n=1 Tax=Streptomyces sp. NBC_01476 TaxID=2903881 RepID=UPI002E2F2D6E|nr:PH domain-containing protein [Streptomyces sp. NBC_01476]